LSDVVYARSDMQHGWSFTPATHKHTGKTDLCKNCPVYEQTLGLRKEDIVDKDIKL